MQSLASSHALTVQKSKILEKIRAVNTSDNPFDRYVSEKVEEPKTPKNEFPQALVMAVIPVDLDNVLKAKSDNVIIDTDTDMKNTKQVIYLSLGNSSQYNTKSRHMASPSEELLSLPDNDDKFKLFLCRLAMGLGGGRAFFDASKNSFPLPTRGDKILIKTVSNDDSYHAEIMGVIQTAGKKAAPSGAPSPTNKDSTKGEKVVPSGPTEPPSSAEKTIRSTAKNNPDSFINSDSRVNAAEWRAILEPKLRAVGKQLFQDPDELDVFVANCLINSWNESASNVTVDGKKVKRGKLKVGNWIFAHPSSKNKNISKYEAASLETPTNCDRPDYSPRCKEKYGPPGPDKNKPYPPGSFAGFTYARFKTIEDAINGHYQYYLVNYDPKKTHFFSIGVSGWIYSSDRIMGYKTVCKLMYLETKQIQGKTVWVATQESYNKLLAEQA